MLNKKLSYALLAIVLVSGFGIAKIANAQISESMGVRNGFGFGSSGMMRSRPVISGLVTAINGSTISVNDIRDNVTYSVDATKAKIQKLSGTASNTGTSITATVADIAVGDNISVQGAVSGTLVTATDIFDGKFGRGMGQFGGGRGTGMMGKGISGTVSAINGSTLTVNRIGSSTASVSYTVDASKATIQKGTNGSATVADIIVGERVVVQGTVSGTSILATRIFGGVAASVGKMPQVISNIQGNGQPVVAGTVSTINGSNLTVTNGGNATYSIDASDAKIQKAGISSSTVSNIVVGDKVIVQGTVNGTSVIATTIIDQTNLANVGKGTSSTQVHMGFFGQIGQFFKHFFGF